jgi:NAD-dependent dihydropyrimidine dehydrogenase PreA subunit
MALRNIVIIDEEKCNGCGECVHACAEGAIKIINGKAKLISEIYCDGLGACIGHCPQDAITVEQREAAEFDEEATKKHLAKQESPEPQEQFVCPGVATQNIRQKSSPAETGTDVPSQLANWPIQMMLIPPQAPYLKEADLLLAADCTAFAMGNFHNNLLKDHVVIIACPKLDNAEFYIKKLSEIIKINKLKSLKVVHMEVPCCFGLTHITREAIAAAEAETVFEDITVNLKGKIIKSEKIQV